MTGAQVRNGGPVLDDPFNGSFNASSGDGFGTAGGDGFGGDDFGTNGNDGFSGNDNFSAAGGGAVGGGCRNCVSNAHFDSFRKTVNCLCRVKKGLSSSSSLPSLLINPAILLASVLKYVHPPLHGRHC